MGTQNLLLVAVDASSGKRCNDFGVNGTVQVNDTFLNSTMEMIMGIASPLSL